MRKCWRANPAERPTFSELASTLDRLLQLVSGYVEFTMTLPASEPGPEEVNIETADQPDAGEGKSSLYFELSTLGVLQLGCHGNTCECYPVSLLALYFTLFAANSECFLNT